MTSLSVYGRRRPLLLALALFASVASLLWICADGSRTLLYAGVFVLALVPGLPLGFALFGRRHAAGWIAGCLLGYGLTAVTFSIAIHLGARTWLGIALSWMILLGLALVARALTRAPLIVLPPWSRADTNALLWTLLLVPALMWLPYARNGASDPGGTRFYRAYFTADFLWHMALTGELRRFSLPPANPYLADQTLHYYWMFFTVPAVGSTLLEPGAHVVEQCLEINAVLSGVLFVAAVFMATWAAVPRPIAVASVVAVAFAAASVQGWYGISDLYARGRSLNGLSQLNIGALTNWLLNGLRIDGLPRSLWWTPQHAAAGALGLIPVVAASAGSVTMPVAGVLLTGICLGLSLAFSPLIGAAFSLVYGLSIIVFAMKSRPRLLSHVLKHALAIIPVAAAAAWCNANQMFQGAGSAVVLGFGGLARHAPIQTLLLALGPLVIPAATSFLRPSFPASAVPHALAVGIGLALLYLVRLDPDPAWVGFRAGQILQITLPGLAAVWLAGMFAGSRNRRVLGWFAVALFLVAGLPTTLIDVYNAQDIANRRMGPGFRWTIDITPEEQAAFEWLKRATPQTAVVQMEPTSRRRGTWTLVPTFAERRMAAGLPISLIDNAEYHRRSDLVKSLYQTTDAGAAWTLARRLGIDYLYVDRTERAAFSEGVGKFDADPRFLPVYRNDEVRVYAVAR